MASLIRGQSSLRNAASRRHLVLAVGAEDAAGLAVDRQPGAFAAMVDHAAARVLGRAEVGPLAEIALQFGKEPGHGVGVVPDVRAGALAAADAFPAVEAAVGEAVRGRRGQDRRVEQRAIEEPVGQRRIVPGVVPEPGLGMRARRSSPPGARRPRRPSRTAWHSNRPPSLSDSCGKCQAMTKVAVASWPASSVIVRTIAPIELATGWLVRL